MTYRSLGIPVGPALAADGRVLVELKRMWADGTSHLLFEPLEFSPIGESATQRDVPL